MFEDRVEAGLLLGEKLKEENLLGSLLFAIPRGGIIVGDTVSTITSSPFYPFIVKKIGAPNNPELAIGAISETGEVLLDEKLINHLKLPKEELKRLVEEKKSEVERRKDSYSLALPNLKGKTVIIIDDGVATGATVAVAALSLKKLGAKKIILATPVIAREVKAELKKYFNKIISLKTAKNLHSVGQFYKNFDEVSDREALSIVSKRSGSFA